MGDVKLALLLGAMLGRSVGVALLVGLPRSARPCVRSLAVRGGSGAQDRDPVRAVPRARRRGRALLRRRDPRLVRSASQADADTSPDTTRRIAHLRPASAARAGLRRAVTARCATLQGPSVPGPIPRSRDFADELRARRPAPHVDTNLGDRAETTPQPARPGGFETVSDLVAELIAATELVPRDRLAAARGRAGAGSLARGAARRGRTRSPDGIARSLARRHDAPVHRPRSDERVSPDAVELDPAARRCSASSPIPVALPGRPPPRRGRRPGEHPRRSTSSGSRAATRSSSASRAATTSSPRSTKLERQSEVLETQSALDEFEVVDEAEDDLEVDDGVSDAPLVRLVNSIIMQAATDGASDIHFEPQEDSLARPRPRRRRAHRDAADPEAAWRTASRRASRCSRSSTSPSAASRRTGASRSRPARSGGCSTSASPCCRPSRASRS